jgi:hypothetical protein
VNAQFANFPIPKFPNSSLESPSFAQPARFSGIFTLFWLFQKHLYICEFLNNKHFFNLIKSTNVAYENNDKKMESIYSKRIRAGKRRTYFFDVRATRGNDYYLTITESRKRFDDNGYDRHKVFLYKEDFNKFIKALNEAVDYVKTELMPDFNFDAYNHDEVSAENEGEGVAVSEVKAEVESAARAEVEVEVSNSSTGSSDTEEVDKW